MIVPVDTVVLISTLHEANITHTGLLGKDVIYTFERSILLIEPKTSVRGTSISALLFRYDMAK